jgi:hypothetical protein
VQRSFAEHGPNVPTVTLTMQLYPLDGAGHDAPVEATAFACRSVVVVNVVNVVVVVNVSG